MDRAGLRPNVPHGKVPGVRDEDAPLRVRDGAVLPRHEKPECAVVRRRYWFYLGWNFSGLEKVIDNLIVMTP